MKKMLIRANTKLFHERENYTIVYRPKQRGMQKMDAVLKERKKQNFLNTYKISLWLINIPD